RPQRALYFRTLCNSPTMKCRLRRRSYGVTGVTSGLLRFLLFSLQSRFIDEMSIKERGSPGLNRDTATSVPDCVRIRAIEAEEDRECYRAGKSGGLKNDSQLRNGGTGVV